MIVAIGGGKGGVGKTTVATNLARELEAVLVDGDLATGDVPASEGPTLHDVLAGRSSPTAAVDDHGTFRTLSSGRTIAGARASDLARLPAVLTRLEREYGRVVVDCPSGLARDVGYQLREATVTVLVTMPDRAALADATRTRDLAVDLETPIGTLVLNHANPSDCDLETLVGHIESTFGVPVSPLETHSTVSAASDLGKPVHNVYPDSPAVDTFGEVARRIAALE